jgi:hypothetical protein
MIYDPKVRVVHATHYPDRVVQHCLCDNIVEPIVNPRLIYDNAACRKGKGTHFAIYRLTGFMREHYRRYGTEGYFLKCDIQKFFSGICHEVLKNLLMQMPFDEDTLDLFFRIVDSHTSAKGKGLPLGNQTSQWFALLYLNPLDRLVKEKLQIRGYSRYMDDMVLIHKDKEYLKRCLAEMRCMAENKLGLSFNEKTQIFPVKCGVNYLGFHFYLTENGKVIRIVRPEAKKRFRRALIEMRKGRVSGTMDAKQVKQRLSSYIGHLRHGHTYHLRSKMLKDF